MSGDHPPAGSGAAPPPSPGRREFLTRVSVALGALGAAIVAIPVVGFLLAPFLEKQSQVWRPVGTVDSFRPGMTVKVDFPDSSPLPWAGVVARTAAWLRRELRRSRAG